MVVDSSVSYSPRKTLSWLTTFNLILTAARFDSRVDPELTFSDGENQLKSPTNIFGDDTQAAPGCQQAT